MWLALGVRRVEADRFAVAEFWPTGASWRVEGRWTLAPPGLVRLAAYPDAAVELRLPQAAEADLPSATGSRWGLRGWVTLRPRPGAWRELHAAAGGRGLEGVVLDAVRAAAATAGLEPEGREPGEALQRELEAALADALAERGVELRRIDLDRIDFLIASAGEQAPLADTRLLVVALDGADWSVIDPLIEQGRLPNLDRLIRHGARAKLASIRPLLSPVVWTTAATGVEPARHGILDFLVDDPQGGSRQPVTSAQRRVPTVWELLSRRGLSVGVVGWWATWPADPVRGYLVSDRLAYQLFGFRADPANPTGKTWPPELYERVRPLVRSPGDIGWDEVRGYLAGERRQRADFDTAELELLDEFRTLLASGETYLAVARELREAYRPRLEVVYFEGTDTAAHLFMPYRPPLRPGVDPRRAEAFGEVVDRYYETADRFLGELLRDRGDGWTVLVLSDHGFATGAARPASADSRIGHGAAAEWHRRFGVLVLSGRHVRAGERLQQASIYDVAPTILALFGQPVPRSWPGEVLAGAIEPAFLERHPVRYTVEDPVRAASRGEAGDDPAAADLLAKLQSLGYVGAGGEGSGGAANARNNAGVSLMAEGRYAEAEAEFRQAIEEAGPRPMLLVNLGLSLIPQRRAGEARPLLEGALADPRALRPAALQLAWLDLEADRVAEAHRLVERVLEREPAAAEAHQLLGRIHEAGQSTAAAREAYRRAAELDPDAAAPRNDLGTLARGAGRLDEAERWFREAIEADPYFMGAYNNLALIYQQRGEFERAIDLYHRALGKAPDHGVVLNNLASLYYARGELDEAAGLWGRLVESEPGYASPWSNLAGIEIRRQRLDEAERLLERALELEPDYADARLNMALVQAARGDAGAAREHLLLAARDEGAAAEAWGRLGMLELQRGRPGAAAEAFREALAAGPADPVAALNGLGEAYALQGRTAEAREAWNRSLALRPEQPRLRRVLQGL